MNILNFAHPLQRIEESTGTKVERVVDVSSQIDVQQPLA